MSLAALGGGLGLLAWGGAGWLRQARAVRRTSPSGYRVPGVPLAEPRPPLEIPIATKHWTRWIVGGPFLVLGLLLTVLVAVVGWIIPGEYTVVHAGGLATAHGTLAAGILSLWYRSGLVLDAERGLFHYWWGIGRLALRSYLPLDALKISEVETVPLSRGVQHYLVLRFRDGKTRRYPRADREDAAQAAERIRRYLRESGLAPG